MKPFIPIWIREGNTVFKQFYKSGGEHPFKYVTKKIIYKNKKGKTIQVTHFVVFQSDVRYNELLKLIKEKYYA